jgi:hypothetical protein
MFSRNKYKKILTYIFKTTYSVITELDIHVFNTFPVKYLCRKNNPNRKHYMLNKCLKNKIITSLKKLNFCIKGEQSYFFNTT